MRGKVAIERAGVPGKGRETPVPDFKGCGMNHSHSTGGLAPLL